jgi:tRNA (cytosine38-C5)-methyltransferase
VELSLQLPKKVLEKAGGAIDIVGATSLKSACFTKSYAKYAVGSGSVFAPATPDNPQGCVDHPVARSLDSLQAMQLRYFSPREVARLHGLPERFAFPPALTRRQQYALLGNSLSVTVVEALLRRLVRMESERHSSVSHESGG